MSNSTMHSGYSSTSNNVAEMGEYRGSRRVLDGSNPPLYRWFPDGELNTCANALERHVACERRCAASRTAQSNLCSAVSFR